MFTFMNKQKKVFTNCISMKMSKSINAHHFEVFNMYSAFSTMKNDHALILGLEIILKQ